jgi:hypothetical protein
MDEWPGYPSDPDAPPESEMTSDQQHLASGGNPYHQQGEDVPVWEEDPNILHSFTGRRKQQIMEQKEALDRQRLMDSLAFIRQRLLERLYPPEPPMLTGANASPRTENPIPMPRFRTPWQYVADKFRDPNYPIPPSGNENIPPQP